MLRVVREKDIVITPDGPRGPSRRMSRGIVFLASRTGNAIVPTAFACSRCWRIAGSWTSLVIPKPFAHVVLLAGEPIDVPAGLDLQDIDRYVSKVQDAMDQLDEKATDMVLARSRSRTSKANPARQPIAVGRTTAETSGAGQHRWQVISGAGDGRILSRLPTVDAYFRLLLEHQVDAHDGGENQHADIAGGRCVRADLQNIVVR